MRTVETAGWTDIRDTLRSGGRPSLDVLRADLKAGGYKDPDINRFLASLIGIYAHGSTSTAFFELNAAGRARMDELADPL